MTLGDWIIVFLISSIPCVNIIMLIVWAVSGTGNINRKRYAQAYIIFFLIVMAISIVVGILFGAIFAPLVNELANQMYQF